MADYKTPGVYVEELSKFPPSVASVATAIPAFIGVTAKCPKGQENKPVKVTSLVDFESKFGEGPTLTITENDTLKNQEYVMYDSLRLFYDNGGGTCYVSSIKQYTDTNFSAPGLNDYKNAIPALKKVDEVTLLLFPDAPFVLNSAVSLGDLHKTALNHCGELKDRFAILDLVVPTNSNDPWEDFRTNVGANNLSYGAAYYPYLRTTYSKEISFDEMMKNTKIQELLNDNTLSYLKQKYGTEKIDEAEKKLYANALIQEIDKLAKAQNKESYSEILAEYQAQAQIITPSAAIAGIYASTDRNKGVWQAPANISISSVSNVTEQLSDAEQEEMNIDSTGKSINAIRNFTGKGILVWGARTLDGNSNEWKYIPVRRLFNYIEESVQKSTDWAVFQPNDANTWVKVQCQIENFLSNLWRDGALAGSTPEKAFYVKVGQDVTMTSDDILNGRMLIEIGLAAVRPAEFIVLKFSHKLQEA